MGEHVLITPETCDCRKRQESDYAPQCPVCDGGLAICAVCGKAEVDLDDDCIVERGSYEHLSTGSVSK